MLSNVLKDTPSSLTEPCLTALELMKFGQLTGEPFEAAEQSKAFPQEIKCLKCADFDERWQVSQRCDTCRCREG